MRTAILLGFLVSFNSAYAQHPGFSKLYHYSEDTTATPDLINTLLYDSATNKLYFHVTGFPVPGRGYFIPSILYRTDVSGNVEKEVLDTLTNGNMLYNSLAASRDGEYLYWGGSCSAQPPGSQTSFYVLKKTDKDLNTIWRKVYPTNAMDGYTLEISTNAVNDDLILLCNRATPSGNSLGLPVLPERIYIRKVDSAGNLLDEYTPGPANGNSPVDMAITDDGGYLVCGRAFSWGQNGDFFSLKSDVAGLETWHEFYFQDHESTYPLQIIRGSESVENYVAIGQSVLAGSDVGFGFVNKMDKDGNEEWRKSLGSDATLDHYISCISTTQNEGYILGGATTIKQRVSAPYGWLVRMDTDGNEIWNRTVTAFPRQDDDEYIYEIVSLPDGSFVAAGSSFGKNVNGRWNQEGWLVRVDSNGCMNPECSGDALSVKSTRREIAHIRVFPNPANDHITVESDDIFPASTLVTIIDNLGRIIKITNLTDTQKKIQVSLEGISPGLYYLKLEGKDGKSYQQKLTLIR